MTKISVITINRNNRDGLRKTMQSVLEQDFDNFEYIVVDGASDDGSVDVIKEFQPLFLERKIVFQYESKPDKGIFNAMNKGVLKSKGEYLLFLNSGDYLVADNVLSSFASLNSIEDYVSGNIMIELDGKQEIRKSPNKVDFLFFFNNSLPHQATFIRKRVFEVFGLYNEENRIKSDWEHSLRSLVVGDASYRHIEHVVSFYDISGVSAQDAFVDLKEQEQRRVYLSIMPEYILDTLYHYREELTNAQPKIRLCDEYLTIKQGKLGFVIRFILWFKNLHRKLKR